MEAKLEQHYSVFLFTIYDSFVCSLHLWDDTVVTMPLFPFSILLVTVHTC